MLIICVHMCVVPVETEEDNEFPGWNWEPPNVIAGNLTQVLYKISTCY